VAAKRRLADSGSLNRGNPDGNHFPIPAANRGGVNPAPGSVVVPLASSGGVATIITRTMSGGHCG
jgi:hypothetical protein